MKVQILNNRGEIVRKSAEVLAQKIESSQRVVLGLGTGATILSICEELIIISREKSLDMSKLVIFHAGEYIGISHKDPSSYHRQLKEKFYSQAKFSDKNIYSLNGESPNLEEECARYDTLIAQEGGLDFFLGSLGENGNLAFNEPGSALDSTTRLKTLSAETIKADARFFNGNQALVPTQVLTLGLKTIFDAKEVLISVYGINKAFAIQACLEGPISAANPASMLQMHPNTTMFVDKVAGRYLSEAWLSLA